MNLRFPESESNHWANRYTERQRESNRVREEYLINLKDEVQARGHLTKEELHTIARWKSPRRAALTLENTENLAEFDKIEIELDGKQDSGDICHIISARSEEYSYRPRMWGSVDIADEVPDKSERLAQFSKDLKDLAEKRYDKLFDALSQGKTVFDINPFYRGMRGKD